MAGENLDWFIYKWVDGVNLNNGRKLLTKDTEEIADTQTAGQMARINSIQGDRFGRWHTSHCDANLIQEAGCQPVIHSPGHLGTGSHDR